MRSARVLSPSLLSLSLLLVGVAACSRDAGTPEKKSAPKAAADSSVATVDSMGRPLDKGPRPATLTRVNEAEGGHVENMALVKGPVFFPLNFTTYATPNVQQAYSQVAGTAMASFTPRLGAAADPNAYIQIQYDTVSMPPVDAAAQLFKKMTAYRKVSDVSVTPNAAFPWAADAKSFTMSEGGKKLAGVILVGKHGPYTYRVIAQYPPSSSKAIYPYFSMVLGQWRWEDDKTYLVPSKPAPPVKVDSAGNPVPRAGTSSTNQPGTPH